MRRAKLATKLRWENRRHLVNLPRRMSGLQAHQEQCRQMDVTHYSQRLKSARQTAERTDFAHRCPSLSAADSVESNHNAAYPIISRLPLHTILTFDCHLFDFSKDALGYVTDRPTCRHEEKGTLFPLRTSAARLKLTSIVQGL